MDWDKYTKKELIEFIKKACGMHQKQVEYLRKQEDQLEDMKEIIEIYKKGALKHLDKITDKVTDVVMGIDEASEYDKQREYDEFMRIIKGGMKNENKG